MSTFLNILLVGPTFRSMQSSFHVMYYTPLENCHACQIGLVI